MMELSNGRLRSLKVYMMVALAVASFTFRWYDKIDNGTLMLMLTPTFIAWLEAHVAEQKAKIAAMAKGE